MSIREHPLSKSTSENRKRINSPSTRRTRRKRRSGNKDISKENLSSSSLRHASPTGTEQKDDLKNIEATNNGSSMTITAVTTNKQLPTSVVAQSLSSSSQDCTPRKTQSRRRIRSQSKLSDLLTSSSNESLLSNK